MKHKLLLVLILSAYLLSQCGEKKESTDKQMFKISLTQGSNFVAANSEINIDINSENEIDIDSVFIQQANVTLIADCTKKNRFSFVAPAKLGRASIPVIVKSGKIEEKHTIGLTVVSDIQPTPKTYKIIHIYNHDTSAYTQGLEYINDTLYESTGLRGFSTLKKLHLQDGDIYQQVKLDKQFFGEGITIVGDSIYQLTWQSNKGFIYDKTSFDKISEFSYPTEGWGLCYDGTHIIMSDGSEFLFFYNRDFSLDYKVAVYNYIGAVTNLNELEYVNNYVYANIYMTDYIVKIDPSTGKVIDEINMEGILSPMLRHANTNVLNGIAYDHKENRIFVTGKKWPKIFEVEFINAPTK